MRERKRKGVREREGEVRKLLGGWRGDPTQEQAEHTYSLKQGSTIVSCPT